MALELLSIQDALNVKAETSGLSIQKCLENLAGLPNVGAQVAANNYAGTQGLSIQLALNSKVGTVGLTTQEAANRLILPPIDGLIFWYRGDSVVTDVDGKISSAIDLSNSNIIAEQVTAANRLVSTNLSGKKGMKCDHTTALNLVVPNTAVFPTPTVSCFTIAQSVSKADGQILFAFGGNTRGGEIDMFSNTIRFNTTALSPNYNLPISNCIYGFTCEAGTAKTTVYVGDKTWADLTTLLTANGTANKGGIIGSYDQTNFGWDGIIYETLYYNHKLTDAEITQLRFYAQWAYGLKSTPTANIMFEGDSLTIGYYDAVGHNWDGYPLKVTWNRPDLQASARAYGGRTWSNAISEEAVDDLQLSTTLDNCMIIFLGTNDLLGAESGADTFAELETYIASRKTAGWDKFIVLTIYPISEVAAKKTETLAYNTLIRDHAAEIGYTVADIAVDDRLADTELGHTYRSTADHIHLNALGYGVVSEYVITALQTVYPI